MLGGSTYANKTSSVLKAIGHHSLHFAHSFEDEERFFKRDTATPDTVWECDRDRVPVKSMGLSDFNEWLAAKYGLSELGARFRDLQARSFARMEWAMMMFNGLRLLPGKRKFRLICSDCSSSMGCTRRLQRLKKRRRSSIKIKGLQGGKEPKVHSGGEVQRRIQRERAPNSRS